MMALRACKMTNQEGNNNQQHQAYMKTMKNSEIWKHELKKLKMIFWI